MLHRIVIGLMVFIGMASLPAGADMVKAKDGSGVFGYKDTPELPGCDYVMHDPDRPLPPIVQPGPAGPAVPAPSDAVVLFDGTDLSAWQPSNWTVQDGQIVAGDGKLVSRATFGDVQVHVEWMAPADFEGPWYAHGNNGVSLMDQFEIQTFDSYNYKIPLYADGHCAAVYGQTPPLVNACRPVGQWQTFDIFFTAPIFEDKELVKPARLTMLHNGVLVHLNQEIYGETRHRQRPVYKQTVSEGPISLPAHYCPVRFRNIWARPLTLPISEKSSAEDAKKNPLSSQSATAETETASSAARASSVSPQRYCNPLPLPNYPVGRMARDAKRGTPVHDAGHWRLSHQEQYRELADPSALWHDGTWYVYPSCDMAWISEDEGLTWQHRPLNLRDIGYAPTIVRHGKRFLLLASESKLYTADSPVGPFRSLGRLQMPNVPGLPGQVDPMLFSDDDGRLYYYWGCTARDGIWAVEIDADNPVQVVGDPRKVIAFEPDRYRWHRLGNANQDLNRGWLEGAWMLKHNGRYYLTYSAGGTEYQTYAMGCVVSDSPLGPFVPQRRNPILRTPEGFLTGTAHGSIVAGPRGRLWVFYTLFAGVAHNFERRIGFDLAAIDSDGELYIPAVTATPQAPPTATPAEDWLPLNQGERTIGSSASPNLDGRFAADLSLLTWWQPAADDKKPVLTTKLIAPSTVHAFRVIWRDVGLDTPSGVKPGPFRYRIDVETEPDAWTTVVDRSTSDEDLLIDYRECKPERAARARLVILDAPAGIAPAVTEFTVFGTVVRQESR